MKKLTTEEHNRKRDLQIAHSFLRGHLIDLKEFAEEIFPYLKWSKPTFYFDNGIVDLSISVKQKGAGVRDIDSIALWVSMHTLDYLRMEEPPSDKQWALWKITKKPNYVIVMDDHGQDPWMGLQAHTIHSLQELKRRRFGAKRHSLSCNGQQQSVKAFLRTAGALQQEILDSGK